MKGPGGRLKFDVRRAWECPRCRRRDRLSGHVAQRACPKCSVEQPVWMALIEERPARPAKASSPENAAIVSEASGLTGTESA